MVWLPNSRVEAHVDARVAPRSYNVNTPQGQIRRNQRDLVVLPQTVTPNETRSSSPNTVTEVPLRRSTRVLFS